MKKHWVLLSVTIIGFVTTGCSTSVNQAYLDYQNKLDMAYSQLENGRQGPAEQYLDEAREIAQENGYEQAPIHQIQAELCWSYNDYDCLQEQIDHLKDVDPSDPRAIELEGRLHIRKYDYSKAAECFARARGGYTEFLDQQRVEDLVALARGLQSYQQGNPQVAARYFQDIQDVEMQYTIDKALKDVN